MTPHQDGTFLNNSPLKLFGFWFPIDDATLENGCLWYVPGSHRMPVTRRFVRRSRNNDGDSSNAVKMVFEGENPAVEDDQWVAAPAKKGSSNFVHWY